MSNAINPLTERDIQSKEARVRVILQSLESAAVAFSGGVDSALLLKLAADALGDACVAVTAVSPSLPQAELDAAKRLAAALGVRHELIETDEMRHSGYRENGADRCYFCKSELFEHAFQAARRLGLKSVVYGATADDVGDHRPGMKAADERGARAPLLEAGLNKPEIRELSKAHNLETWDKPAMACLSSRFPYGTAINPDRLSRVEKAEAVLRSRGYRTLRVRYHGTVARLEVGVEEWERLQDARERELVAQGIKACGFAFVALDLEPFASGRLNVNLPES